LTSFLEEVGKDGIMLLDRGCLGIAPEMNVVEAVILELDGKIDLDEAMLHLLREGKKCFHRMIYYWLS
jgi:hypothetical protein